MVTDLASGSLFKLAPRSLGQDPIVAEYVPRSLVQQHVLGRATVYMRPLASPVASVSCVWCTSEDKHHLQ